MDIGSSLAGWDAALVNKPLEAREPLTCAHAHRSRPAVGEADGVGNRLPDTPLVKCGIAFTKKAPPKK